MKRVVLAATLVLLSACSNKGVGEAATPQPTVMKIAVLCDGQITVNGRKVTIDEMIESLGDLAKKENGVVWLYREVASTEPSPNATIAFDGVMGANLPISLSTKPDFSDVVMADGTAKPRSQMPPNNALERERGQ
jgi:uncharacterized lipoprotein YajG